MPRLNVNLVTLLLPLAFSATAAAQMISTVAGTGKPDNNGDSGWGAKTNVGDPFGVEVGPDGALYITEVRHHRVRRLDLRTNQLTTVAGNGELGYAGDGGPATKAKLNEPYEVRFDKGGNLLFVEMKNHLVRRVDAQTGDISTVAGTGQAGFGGDGGLATKAQFSSPHSIALDAHDNLYIADIGNHRIRRIDAKTGLIETVAGDGGKSLPVEGQVARDKSILGPRALYIEKETLWIALREGHSVWKMALSDGVLHHVAGTGKRGNRGDGGPAQDAEFDGPKGIAVGPDGVIVVVDTENHAIRRFDPKSNVITTLAAKLNRPHGICVGPDGAVYIGDTLNHRVLKVTP